MERDNRSRAETEDGRNVELTVHFMRHGPKNPKGKLTWEGYVNAWLHGRSLERGDELRVYTGTHSRVRKTGALVKTGAQADDKYRRRALSELSTDILFTRPRLSDFQSRVDARLQTAHRTGSEEAIALAERENIADWLSFGDSSPDPGTASSREVAQILASLLIKELSTARSVKNNSHVRIVNVTSEFHIMAMLRHLLKRTTESGVETGEDIVQKIGRVPHFGELKFVAQTDSAGARGDIEIEFMDQKFEFDWEKMNDLLDGGTEVLDNVTDIFGRAGHDGLLSEALLQQLVYGEANRLIIIGQPGCGKTTILNQAKMMLERRGVKTQTVYYDDVLRETVDQLGIPDTHWGQSHRAVLVANMERALKSHHPDHVQLIEIPSFGEKERGQSALNRLSPQERERMMAIWLVQNIELQAHAALLRKFALKRSLFGVYETLNRQLEDQLRAKYNIRIVGWPPEMSASERGRRIRETLKKMAMPQDIEKISLEVTREVQRSGGAPISILDIVPPGMRSALKRVEADLQFILLKSVDMEIPSTTIAYNPVIRNKPITWHAQGMFF